MTMESRAAATTAFVINSPFDSALPQIRRAIGACQLSIAGEIDASQRVKRALEIYVPPCRVLLVDSPAFMLETTAIDRASGIFIPLHVVVSGAGNRTLIHILSAEHIQSSNLPIGVRAPILDLQRQVVRGLLRIAERMRNIYELADRGQDHSKAEPVDGFEAASPVVKG
ncbi:MAG TPA: DUF302 domain-containing protein [Bryobacteraceae bacterium]|nr:DUF302 domain-containing protein [Bryobacteraceae bacterium]